MTLNQIGRLLNASAGVWIAGFVNIVQISLWRVSLVISTKRTLNSERASLTRTTVQQTMPIEGIESSVNSLSAGAPGVSNLRRAPSKDTSRTSAGSLMLP